MATTRQVTIVCSALFWTACAGAGSGSSGGSTYVAPPLDTGGADTLVDADGSGDAAVGSDVPATADDTTSAADAVELADGEKTPDSWAQSDTEATDSAADAGSTQDTGIVMQDVPPYEADQTATPQINPILATCPDDGIKKDATTQSVGGAYHVKVKSDGSLTLHGPFELKWPGAWGATGCFYDGKPVGAFTGTWSIGTKRSQTYFNDAGEEHGPSKGWHDNGKPWWDATFNKGERVGFSQTWNAGGYLTWKTWYDGAGQRQGKAETWYDNGKVDGAYWYKDDKLHGPTVRYWAGGVLRYTGASDSGLNVGLHRSFNYTGKLAGETTYNKGNGTMVLKWDDGSPRLTMTQKDGKLHGAYSAFFLNGNKDKEGLYDLGSGAVKRYYDSGKLYYAGNEQDGLLHGVVKVYADKTGDTISELTFAKGAMHGTATYFAKGAKSYEVCWIKGWPVLNGLCDVGML